jgi:hypothetical protein
MEDPPEYPGAFVARLVTDAPTSYALLGVTTYNWLRVSTGVGGRCYDGIEMMRERSTNCCIAQ